MSTVSHLRIVNATQGLRFRVRGDGGFESVLDSGEGRIAANPVETLLHALGGCLAMDLISLLRKKRQDVTDYEVIVTGERRPEHPRSYTSIDVLHRVTGNAVSRIAVEDSLRLSVERYCSVLHSLDPGIPITQRIEIVEAAPPEEAPPPPAAAAP
jgi:putative redox protein